MKVLPVTINYEAFGALFANMDSKDQGLFFKGLANELNNFGSLHGAQMQMFYIAKELSPDEKETLKETLSCLWETAQ